VKHSRCLVFLLLLGSVVLAACVKEGTSGFSSTNQVAVISDERLFTWDMASGGYDAVEPDPILWGFGASINQQGNILYAKLAGSTIQICIFRASTFQSSCPVIALGQGDSTSGGLLSYLPSDDLLVVYDKKMHIYTNNGVEITLAGNAGVFSVVPHIYKVKRDTGGTEWYMKPYAKSGCAQNQKLHWVVIQDNDLVYRYSVGAGLEGPTLLPRQITNDIRAVLEHLEGGNITTSTLSPDGTKLVIRTGAGNAPFPAPFDLYILDLETNTGGLVRLVEGAAFRVQCAFSPCGDQLAYESNVDGHSVWILDLASGVRAKLADGASLPHWYPE
jgi:hypothetical protein